MHDTLIGLLCDGDLHSRSLARQYFSIDELATLAAEKEKAAATNSDQFKEIR